MAVRAARPLDPDLDLALPHLGNLATPARACFDTSVALALLPGPSPAVAVGLLAVALLAAAGPARAVDCGRLPTGKNPTPEELDAEIARASGAHNVPTEIIKGVAWQESGCQQWRPDGTFVHNKTDCGLGMMQLTGATARQFDVERLKDDWRYNLDAGVTVLVEKWKRAERKGQVPSDPEARRVLENWYYPVAYYWGRESEEYLRKIFGHLERRPGALQRLLRAPIQVSIASEVIPGFTFGDKFRAWPDGRFEDKDGKVHRARTNPGTVGDPQTLAALEVALERGKKAHERGQTKRAIGYLRHVVGLGLDTPHRAEAQALLDALAKDGEAAVAAAEAQAQGGDAAGAKRALKRLLKDWEGLDAVTTRAQAALDRLD